MYSNSSNWRMFRNMLIFQIGFMFIAMGRGISKDLIEYDMASRCGSKVELMDNKDGRVYFRQNGRNISKCTFKLRNSFFTDYDEIAFHFTEFSGTGLACVHIKQYYIFPEAQTRTTIKGLDPSYCNGTFPDLNTIYTTRRHQTLYITFESQYNGNASFEFVFNAFETDYYTGCENSYRCDNDRCIPNDVNCNGHNPCGDNSDCQIREEKKKDNAYEIDVYDNDSQDESILGDSQNIAIVVATIVAVILIVICVICGRTQGQRETVIGRPLNVNSRVPREVPNLALPRQESPQVTQRRSFDNTTHNLEPLDYSTHAVTDLPPSYDDVICNEQKYKLSTNIERLDS